MKQKGLVSTNNTNDSYKLVFWNIEGIKKVSLMDASDIVFFKSHDIIIFYETWLEEEVNLETFEDYHQFHVLAHRENEMGRGSGGITFLIKQNSFVHFKCTFRNRYFLGMHLETGQSEFTIIASYIPPRVEYDVVVEDLEEIFYVVNCNKNVMWLGDFNARIGELGEISPLVQLNSCMSYERNSADKTKNVRGKKLIDEMENQIRSWQGIY